jgi:hypothetical protein
MNVDVPPFSCTHNPRKEFSSMFVLKALAVGFGIVLSLIIVTFVYVYLQAAPNEKATGIIVVLASPYYWIMVILVVALEAWFLMRHRAG